MQFCDECGSLMHADDEEMVCSSCGASQRKEADLSERYPGGGRRGETDRRGAL
jgi:DNA-directed RNA polymerase subunit M